MTDTYTQLLRRYDRPCITLDEFRAEYLPQITSMKYLRAQVAAGRIRIRYTRHSKKAPPVVYLHDLAKWLDAQNPNHHTAASEQAA